MNETVLNELGLVCALGRGKAAVRESLLEGRASGMRPAENLTMNGCTYSVGQFEGELPSITHALPRFQSRSNQLLLAALEEIRPAVCAAIGRFGSHRVGVVMGTSSSGMAEAEAAFLARGADGKLPETFHYGQMEMGSPSEFLALELGLSGPAFTMSTACSSSAKALASARRLLRAGFCDAVLVGGADSVCRFTLAGFLALSTVSHTRCQPFREGRTGINLGEGAAIFLMTGEGSGPRLLGVGESSDAYHVSAPEPNGTGAIASMSSALRDARVTPARIDYLNAHGTATLHNDAMEAKAVAAVLGAEVPVTSTKPLSGHTLGAAGALEAAFCWLLIENGGPLPAQVGEGAFDPALPLLNLLSVPLERAPAVVMSNSCGFGGSNASLVLARQ